MCFPRDRRSGGTLPAGDVAGRSRAARGETGSVAGTLAGVLGGVLTFLVIVLGLLWFGHDWGDEAAEPPLTASPLRTTPPPASPTPTPMPAPTPTPTPTPATPEPTEREPTDADAAAFTSAFEPPGGRDVESVTVDMTGDGQPEIVVVSVAEDAVRLDVATWTGTAYDVAFSDAGGPADTVERFTVRDLTGNGTRDIATVQMIGQDRESMALWGWDGEQFVRHEARGGCWDGSHVYGIVGVAMADGELAATCDGSPEPVGAWPTDVYVWEDGAWRYDRTETP